MPNLETSTLRPGLLVTLSTSVKGNISYDKQTIEPTHIDNAGQQKAKWETERTVSDLAEMKAAWDVQAKARAFVSDPCNHSNFGLLCPEEDATKLAEGIAKANSLVDEFNARSRITTVKLYVMVGRIAQDDLTAARAINREVRELLDEVRVGIRDLDVSVIRKAATKAKAIGGMLSPEVAERVKNAVDAARSIARKIVKAGESAAVEIDQASLRQITEARTAFLDMSGPTEIAAPPEEEGRELPPTPLEAAIEATRQPRYRGRERQQ